jgi:hypothetical protein
MYVLTYVNNVRKYVHNYIYDCVYSVYNIILKKMSLIFPRILQDFLYRQTGSDTADTHSFQIIYMCICIHIYIKVIYI